MFTPSGYPCVPSKMFNQFVLAVWPAIANILYIYIYLNRIFILCTYFTYFIDGSCFHFKSRTIRNLNLKKLSIPLTCRSVRGGSLFNGRRTA